MSTVYLAIDIGASSGRHIVSFVENGTVKTQEVYRFSNGAALKDGHLCWDREGLFHHVLEGLKAAKDQGFTPAFIGIDTWAVDFVLLDENDRPLGDMVAYRDSRTEGMDALLAIVQMPPGIPVATVGVNGALNAAILAAEMMALSDEALAAKLKAYKQGLKEKIVKANEELSQVKYKFKVN